MKPLTCPRCGSQLIVRKGSVLSPRGRVQRYQCTQCHKKFHPSLKTQPFTEKEGFWDIETSQAGRGAGNFGIIYSWAIKLRGGAIISDVLTHHSLAAERVLISRMIRELKKLDRVYTYYGTEHDVKVSRTRSLFHGLEFPEYMQLYHTDVYYVVRNRLNLHSKKLEVVAKFLGIDDKTPLEPSIWVDAVFGDKEAMAYIHEHNRSDVITLEKVNAFLEPYYQGTRRSI